MQAVNQRSHRDAAVRMMTDSCLIIFWLPWNVDNRCGLINEDCGLGLCVTKTHDHKNTQSQKQMRKYLNSVCRQQWKQNYFGGSYILSLCRTYWPRNSFTKGIFSLEIARFSLALAEIFPGEAQTDTQINSAPAFCRLNDKLMLVMALNKYIASVIDISHTTNKIGCQILTE